MRSAEELPCRRRLAILALSAWALIGQPDLGAEVQVIAEYRLGAVTPQITYTGGPETMPDAAATGRALKREGNPRFLASAPAVPSAKGTGALEFDGKKVAYVRAGALFDRNDRFGLEAWVRGAEASVKGLKGVVANGNGAQVNESLLMAGSPSHDPALIKRLLDQMGEMGFESYIITCWPGVSHDNLDPAYVAKWKDLAAYAKAKGIIMSGYELMVASRGRGAAQDCIDPATGKAGSPFGQSVCLGTKWADDYFDRVWKFIDQTGFLGIAVDGPYHGCPCGSTAHPHHRGLADSQWVQWQRQKKMFEEEQRRGMSAGAPDWYSWNGQSSTSLGFREASANLPRELGLLLYRQYIYDGTWFKPPTMGGMGMGLIGGPAKNQPAR